MSPNEGLLNRKVHELVEPELSRAVCVIERCVNYGTHLIARFDHRGQFGQRLAAVLLGLHAVETLDAIGVLLSRCCTDPAKSLMRGQLEALFGIQYMAESDSERRSIQYLVGHAHSRIEWYERLDPTTEAGKQLRALIGKDFTVPDLEVVSKDTAAEVQNLRDMLARPEFQKVEAEWQRLRAQKKGRLWWYSLFDGPISIEGLSKAIGEYALYQLLYRLYSAESHATNAIESLHMSQGQRRMYQPIRYPIEVPTMAHLAVVFALKTYRALIDMLMPQLNEEYRRWYTNEIHRDFMNLSSVKIKDESRVSRNLRTRGQ